MADMNEFRASGVVKYFKEGIGKTGNRYCMFKLEVIDRDEKLYMPVAAFKDAVVTMQDGDRCKITGKLVTEAKWQRDPLPDAPKQWQTKCIAWDIAPEGLAQNPIRKPQETGRPTGYDAPVSDDFDPFE